MRALTRHLKRAAGLGAVAVLALPAAAQAADYRGQLSESFSSGTAGVSPTLAVTATIDNGSGGPPVTTGSMRFAIDARHLSPTVWAVLTGAPVGTQVGTLKSELTGKDATPIRVLAHSRERAARSSAPASACRPTWRR